jgi:hypothetical protein
MGVLPLKKRRSTLVCLVMSLYRVSSLFCIGADEALQAKEWTYNAEKNLLIPAKVAQRNPAFYVVNVSEEGDTV